MAVALAVISSALVVSAADDNAAFTAALRERGWHDTAVEYLDWVEQSPLITQDFRSQLPFERAQSLAAQARGAGNRTERERLFGEAAAAFIAFADGGKSPDAAIDALREAANLVAEQGLATLAAAKQLPHEATGQREDALRRAREQFDKAMQLAERVVELCAEEIAGLPKATVIQSDPYSKARRDRLRGRHAEARYLGARLLFEQAATHDAKSAEFEQRLNEASRRFGQLNEEFRGSVVGDSSRFYQGRCAQELGAFEKALGCYDDVVRNSPADPEFRRVAARAHRRIVECLLADGKIEDAIRHGSEWLAAASPAERDQPEWLETAFRLADAYQAKAKAEEVASDEAKRLQSEVRSLIRDVSQKPNEFQSDARLAMAGANQANGGTQSISAKSFDEALAAGKAALALWNSSSLAVRLARENNPDAVAELQKQAEENRQQAQLLFEQAMDLADRQTPIQQVNSVRYYLAVMYWENEDLYDAAVLSEFLATRYPESEFAPAAAKVAFYAYERLSIEAQRNARDAGASLSAATYEAKKLAELAEFIATRWPEAQEASAAVNVLIQTALREDRLADAEALLERLPEQGRGAAELSLGAGLWTKYLRITAGPNRDSAVESKDLREKAGQFLAAGFSAVREKGKPTAVVAAGSLYLVQFKLAQGDVATALEVLQDEAVGPLSLVESGDSAASRPEFVIETYKTALRAFLSADPPRREEAEQIMAALDQRFENANGDEAGEQLTDVYLGLGVQLQRQLTELTDAGKTEQAQQVATAFGDVLTRIASRPDADTWRVRNWLAQTNLQIARSLAADDGKVYAERARDVYKSMLASMAKNNSYAPSEAAALSVKMRLGESLAALGQYREAVEQYGSILRNNPNMLDLQLAAAASLQEWGVAKRDVAVLERAIRGDLPQADGKNLIWGWLRLAAVVDSARTRLKNSVGSGVDESRAMRYEDLFFEARYNVARTRYLAGTVSPPSSRREYLQSAKTNIEQMVQLYPELGGEKWKNAFNQLRAQIDKELAKK